MSRLFPCRDSEFRALVKVIDAPGQNQRRRLGLCPSCGRVLAETRSGKIRTHSLRGKNTRSHDSTMETIYVMFGGRLTATAWRTATS